MAEINKSRTRENMLRGSLLFFTLGGLMLIGADAGPSRPAPANSTVPIQLVNTGFNPNHSVSGQELLDAEQALDDRLSTGKPITVLEGVTVCGTGKGGPFAIVNAIETTVDGQEVVGSISNDGGVPHVHLTIYGNPGQPTTDLPACKTIPWGQEPDKTGTKRSVILSWQDEAITGNFVGLDPQSERAIQTKFGDDMVIGLQTSSTASGQ